MSDEPSEDRIREVLQTTRVVAVVGISPKPDRASHRVAGFLARKGYRVIPVNPGHAGEELFGETVYADLAAIPDTVPVDMVDIFRRSEHIPPVVEQALAHLPHLRTIWMQLGIRNPEAAAEARARGVTVIEDRCPVIEYPRLIGG